MSQLTKGSEWRKWDLHFHSPSSYDYGDKSVTNEQIIKVLDENNISVVAITDHHIIDIDRIKMLQSLGKKKDITVLPGIEFLSDARGKVPIHFIGIFPEESKIDFIWGQLENKTNISKIKGEGKKKNEVYCDLEETIKIVKELGGLVTIHAGNKSNSLENITNSLPHNIAQKIEITNLIDIFELGKVTDKDDYLNIVFPAIKKHIPMVIASDNHNINKYILKENCWIKADPTFEGLKQVVYEPRERVRIQSLLPHDKADYQVISSVSIKHKDFTKQIIGFSQNLNTIIGGRSTGKSILLGAIAKKLNSDKEVKFGNEHYTDFVNDVVTSIEVKWKDGSINDNRNIEYFPQSYMYQLAKNKDNELDNLIEQIIKQDAGKHQLITNYEVFSNENNTKIINDINKLFQLKDTLKAKLHSSKELGDESGIRKEIEKLNKELEELKLKIDFSDDNLKKYNILKSKIDSLLKTNEELAHQISKINTLKTKLFTNDNFEFEIISLNEKNKIKTKEIFNRLTDKFEKEWNVELDKLISDNQSTVVVNVSEIEKIKTDSLYIKGIEVFKNNKQFKETEERLKVQKNKLADIEVIKNNTRSLNEQIVGFIDKIKLNHREFHNKIEIIKEQLTISRDKLVIQAEARLNARGYLNTLNRCVNQQGFQGQKIVNIEINNGEDYFNHSHMLFDDLVNDKVTLKGGSTNIELCQKILATNYFDISYTIIYEDIFQQMSEGKKAFVVLMLLLDFSNMDCPILIDQPEDDLDNRAIYRELVKYLKTKKKERQIILVTHNPNIAVGADSELIIVANQNGVDSPNKDNRKFQYTSGSLENTLEYNEHCSTVLESQGIREHVCEILEGGSEAFKQREVKYNLS